MDRRILRWPSTSRDIATQTPWNWLSPIFGGTSSNSLADWSGNPPRPTWSRLHGFRGHRLAPNRVHTWFEEKPREISHQQTRNDRFERGDPGGARYPACQGGTGAAAVYRVHQHRDHVSANHDEGSTGRGGGGAWFQGLQLLVRVGTGTGRDARGAAAN